MTAHLASWILPGTALSGKLSCQDIIWFWRVIIMVLSMFASVKGRKLGINPQTLLAVLHLWDPIMAFYKFYSCSISIYYLEETALLQKNWSNIKPLMWIHLGWIHQGENLGLQLCVTLSTYLYLFRGASGIEWCF